MAIGVDVLQSNGVRVWRDVDAESRVVPAFEVPFGNPEEQRDVIRLVVRHHEIGKPVLVEIRDGQVHWILAGGTGPGHFEAAVTPTRPAPVPYLGSPTIPETIQRARLTLLGAHRAIHSPAPVPYLGSPTIPETPCTKCSSSRSSSPQPSLPLVDGINNDIMRSRKLLTALDEFRRNPQGIRFRDLAKVERLEDML